MKPAREQVCSECGITNGEYVRHCSRFGTTPEAWDDARELVDRLRAWDAESGWLKTVPKGLVSEAADRIEELEAEVERLRSRPETADDSITPEPVGICVGSYRDRGPDSEDLLLVRPAPGVAVPQPIGTKLYAAPTQPEPGLWISYREGYVVLHRADAMAALNLETDGDIVVGPIPAEGWKDRRDAEKIIQALARSALDKGGDDE